MGRHPNWCKDAAIEMMLEGRSITAISYELDKRVDAEGRKTGPAMKTLRTWKHDLMADPRGFEDDFFNFSRSTLNRLEVPREHWQLISELSVFIQNTDIASEFFFLSVDDEFGVGASSPYDPSGNFAFLEMRLPYRPLRLKSAVEQSLGVDFSLGSVPAPVSVVSINLLNRHIPLILDVASLAPDLSILDQLTFALLLDRKSRMDSPPDDIFAYLAYRPWESQDAAIRYWYARSQGIVPFLQLGQKTWRPRWEFGVDERSETAKVLDFWEPSPHITDGSVLCSIPGVNIHYDPFAANKGGTYNDKLLLDASSPSNVTILESDFSPHRSALRGNDSKKKKFRDGQLTPQSPEDGFTVTDYLGDLWFRWSDFMISDPDLSLRGTPPIPRLFQQPLLKFYPDILPSHSLQLFHEVFESVGGANEGNSISMGSIVEAHYEYTKRLATSIPSDGWKPHDLNQIL